MKIRTDFVTNSSSSSFVIGKKDDKSATIESVYSIVKDLYKEYLSKRDSLIEYIKNNPKLKLEYREDKYWGGSYGFHYTDDKLSKNKKYEINKFIERDFGISVFDTFEEDYEWLSCETYKEYEKYWITKMKENKDWNVHGPFTITDFSSTEKVNCIHINTHGDDYDYGDIRSDVFNWYCGEEYKDEEEIAREKNISVSEVYLNMLGRICIHSESGYIPNYVVERLHDISEYGCNHMG